MKEIHEFRIFKDQYHLLSPNDAIFNGAVYVLKTPRESNLFDEIGELNRELRLKQEVLFSFWDVRRIYTKAEINNARLFHFIIKSAFEPTGEECGTIYDELSECDICGANRQRIGPLQLKKGSIPRKDIARTIAGEVVVSDKFVQSASRWQLKGISFECISFKGAQTREFHTIKASHLLSLSQNTVTGHHAFDLSQNDEPATEFFVPGGYKVKFEKTILNCPKGHLAGLRLISESFIVPSTLIDNYDFFVTREMIGAKQGLLRPEPIYLCSPRFREMILTEKLTGFDFEIARIDTR